MSDVGSARKAREHLRTLIGDKPWCAGIGVEREDGIGFIVRVSTRSATSTDLDSIPTRVGEVVVKVIQES